MSIVNFNGLSFGVADYVHVRTSNKYIIDIGLWPDGTRYETSVGIWPGGVRFYYRIKVTLKGI